MKSTTVLYRYNHITRKNNIYSLNIRHAAITGSIYTLNVSVLVVLIYSWMISTNVKNSTHLQDVFYGVQIAYSAVIGTNLFIFATSVVLILGIVKERVSLIVPWIVGLITFMALEAVAVVYSNVLRDHVNKQFDSFCKIEVIFYLIRAILNF
ncbi:uncharacterized protein LOC126894569 isoform X2 [Daktulosphaira vitifoliae]|uniref:uncharacterized protein LOC126894569 isoform X2 n=1 Tax=Daktulosphaira vitifoliae TaxID=58002 RepID=UPI0021A9E07A|nr:uncharacterized protein LOC126894569 isoform X2 [Daktulosphaira vitifoliae]